MPHWCNTSSYSTRLDTFVFNWIFKHRYRSKYVIWKFWMFLFEYPNRPHILICFSCLRSHLCDLFFVLLVYINCIINTYSNNVYVFPLRQKNANSSLGYLDGNSTGIDLLKQKSIAIDVPKQIIWSYSMSFVLSLQH